MIELFSPPAEAVESMVHLPKPRALMFDEVTETHGGFVLQAQIQRGFGPFKYYAELNFLGGNWVARASSRPRAGVHCA